MNSTKAACRIKNDTKLGRIMQVDWYIGETLIKLRAVEVDENEELIIPTTPIEGSIYLVEINSSLKAAVKHMFVFAAILAKQKNMRVFMINTSILLVSTQPPTCVKDSIHSAWDEYWVTLCNLCNFRRKY